MDYDLKISNFKLLVFFIVYDIFKFKIILSYLFNQFKSISSFEIISLEFRVLPLKLTAQFF